MRKKEKIDKKFFWVILRSVSIELVVMAAIFALIGMGVASVCCMSCTACTGIGGIIGVMLALVSVYRRMRMYLGD